MLYRRRRPRSLTIPTPGGTCGLKVAAEWGGEGWASALARISPTLTWLPLLLPPRTPRPNGRWQWRSERAPPLLHGPIIGMGVLGDGGGAHQQEAKPEPLAWTPALLPPCTPKSLGVHGDSSGGMSEGGGGRPAWVLAQPYPSFHGCPAEGSGLDRSRCFCWDHNCILWPNPSAGKRTKLILVSGPLDRDPFLENKRCS